MLESIVESAFDESIVVLLIRSYNRPQYLKTTLDSILASDVNHCKRRYIYDDGSTDTETLRLLSDPTYVNVPTKEFIVINNEVNVGCKQSYLNALAYIKCDNIGADTVVCTVDNDVVVKKQFISIIAHEYEKARVFFNTTNILLTGFNPTNAHMNKIKEYDTFYRKETCGGINFVFHIDFLDFICQHWSINLDFGVNSAMQAQNMPLLCLNTSAINHIGEFGLNSHGSNRVDEDVHFTV